MKKVGEKWEIMRFMGKFIGEGRISFGSGCLNRDLWDLGIFRMSVRVGVGNPSHEQPSAISHGSKASRELQTCFYEGIVEQELAPTEDLRQGRLGSRRG